MSERTNDEINLAVAEIIEPRKSLGDPSAQIAVFDEPKPSPLKCWRAVSFYSDGDEAKWIPHNFCEDGNAILMLMEREDFLAIETVKSNTGRKFYRVCFAGRGFKNWSDWHPELKRSVCEAFLAAQGRKED